MNRILLTICIAVFACVAVPGISSGQRPGDPECKSGPKLCPDGSYVRRVGPDCEFAACPRIELPYEEANEEYGYSEHLPIAVLGLASSGPESEREYLSRLISLDGKKIEYKRVGNCCPFKNHETRYFSMLDVYEVSYEGLEAPIELYFNMYDEYVIPLQAPKEFSFRTE